jgi:hypothetical protein
MMLADNWYNYNYILICLLVILLFILV